MLLPAMPAAEVATETEEPLDEREAYPEFYAFLDTGHPELAALADEEVGEEQFVEWLEAWINLYERNLDPDNRMTIYDFHHSMIG